MSNLAPHLEPDFSSRFLIDLNDHEKYPIPTVAFDLSGTATNTSIITRLKEGLSDLTKVYVLPVSIWRMADSQDCRKDTLLLNNGCHNVFYVNKDGSYSVVNVFLNKGALQWRIDARPYSSTYSWPPGTRIFAHKAI